MGGGLFVGLTVMAALLTSLVLDHYGWLQMPIHSINPWRIAGALLMVVASF